MASALAPTRGDLDSGTLARSTAGLVPYAPLVLRVVAGLIFLVYGWNKVQNPAGFEQLLIGLGFPATAILSWLVIALEVAGGAALIVGLLVRPIAQLFAIEMIVSSVTVKLDLGFAPEGATGIELDLALPRCISRPADPRPGPSVGRSGRLASRAHLRPTGSVAALGRDSPGAHSGRPETQVSGW